MNTSGMTYDRILDLTKRLEPAEQLRLLEALAQSLRQNLAARPRGSILELRGLGKEVWQNVDVDAYINRERNSWDG